MDSYSTPCQLCDFRAACIEQSMDELQVRAPRESSPAKAA